ncbi:MAG: hypothetical protein ACOYM3_32300 [Terrimicrobiaceae bacterium]
MEIQLPPGVPASSIDVLKAFAPLIDTFLRKWRTRLAEDVSAFPEAEVAVRKCVTVIEGWLLACLLEDPGVRDSICRKGEELRRERGMRQGNRVSRTVRFLCGLVVTVVCWYVAPSRTVQMGRPRGQGKRNREGSGLYPELAVLGIHEGISPALRNEATRQAVLLPSLEQARKEMGRRGTAIEIKQLLRIVRETGYFVQAQRREWLLDWRRGALRIDSELVGKRVGVAIDGGRTRTRENLPQGRKTKSGRRRFKTPWREPKLLIIYVLDERGRSDPSFPPFIDGTMEGPDALMELLAMHLHRMGASKAKEGVFLGDGAEWIWARVPWVIEKVGLREALWHCAVDFYHVMEHVSAALETVFANDPATKQRQRGRLKKMLKRGEREKVVGYLQDLSARNKAVEGQIAYIERRRNLVPYADLLRRRLPIGSGAIESAIRRVINQRMKSPGMFWRWENIEPMLYMRAQALTSRWEEMMRHVQTIAKFDRRRDVSIEPTPPCPKPIHSLLTPANSDIQHVAA